MYRVWYVTEGKKQVKIRVTMQDDYIIYNYFNNNYFEIHEKRLAFDYSDKTTMWKESKNDET